MDHRLDAFVASLPKAELHLHIEGTLEPELMFRLAARNQVALPYPDVAALRAAYQFTDLQSFLDIYYHSAAVLRTEDDFAELMAAYLEKAIAQGVVRAEIFFDPQTHTARGIPFAVFMEGFDRARSRYAGQISADLIMCFLRHLPEASALATLEAAGPYLDKIVGVGLDSSEVGHPPQEFARVFAEARATGLRTVAHAGEEGPPEYIWGALDVLGVERVDHGVRCLEDGKLVARLATEQTPLTVCPMSNVRLKVVETMAQHPLRQMLEAGLNVSINSDDPAFFGGYIGDNYREAALALQLTEEELAAIAQRSLAQSFETV
ncbi:MAG TPA: adenosine deaminase [Acidimicrobiia bacterium]|nr:adenosine deaminase [Acidimicrobiia bacterium]